MSQINNRIVTTYSASAGNAIAVQGQLTGSLRNTSRAVYDQTVMSERLNAQWRAFGTTIRYALAGSVIFGATRLLSVLRDTQRQYALIGAIGGGVFDSQITGTKAADAALQQLYQNAQSSSLEAITPVNDFNDALVNLYSTVQGLTPDRAIQLTTALSQGAQLAQVPVDDLTRSITGLNQAFGRPQTLQNIQQGIRGFFTLTQQAPGGIAYGPQFIQQLAPLGAVSRLAAITPQEMYGLFLTETRIGSTPATAGRGLQYLLQSIAVPTSKGHAQALAAAGITPQSVQDKGGVWAIRQLIRHVQQLGVRGNLRRAANTPDDTLDLLDTADPGQQARGLGVSGKGVEFLTKAIGRIHGVRALIALMAQEQATNRMTRDQEVIAQAMANTEKAQKDFADKWDDFARRQPLQAASVSVDVLRRQVISAFEPALNLAGRGVSKVGATAITHPDETRKVILGGAAVAAAIGLAKGVGLRGLLRGGGGGLALATAAEDAIQNGASGPGMSPQNPIYVMVVGQLFGPGGMVGKFGRGPGPLGGVAEDAAVGGAAGRRGLFRRAIPFAGPVGAGAVASMYYDESHPAKKNPTLWDNFNRGFFGIPGQVGRLGSAWSRIEHKANERQRQEAVNAGMLPPDPALQRNVNAWFRSVGGEIVLKGEANVIVDLNLKNPDGTTQRKRVHVPVDLWSGGRAPGSRGRKGNTHRGGPN